MHQINKSFFCTISLVISFIPISSHGGDRCHFYSETQKQLKEYNPIWNKLFSFYGEYLPDKIIVKQTSSKEPSRFYSQTNTIAVNTHSFTAMKHAVAHETSHIALNNMTNGSSILEPFRFIDEGWASVLENRIADTSETYIKYALFITGEELNKGNLSIQKLQDWTNYFGDWHIAGKKTNHTAYDVAASFVIYILDVYGEDKFVELLKGIGHTKSFHDSVNQIFGKSLDDIENGWFAFVKVRYAELQKDILNIRPKVVFMNPGNGASNVSINKRKLVVKFNTPMHNEICLTTDCKDICYQNAHWKNSNTLVINIHGSLHGGKTYFIGLGNNGNNCFLRTVAGQPLPVMSWKFSTR